MIFRRQWEKFRSVWQRQQKQYGCEVIAFAGSVTEEAIKCNEKGIDAFFSILPRVCSLDEAMDTEIAQKNMRNAAEQVFRWILGGGKEKTSLLQKIPFI